MKQPQRHILVVSRTGRQSSVNAAEEVCRQLLAEGVTPVVQVDERAAYLTQAPDLSPPLPRSASRWGCTTSSWSSCSAAATARSFARRIGPRILGAVALGQPRTRRASSPKASGTTSPASVKRALARDYQVEERMTLSVRVKVDSEVVYETWALNEATVEKASRERMLEVVIEVDGRQVSSFRLRRGRHVHPDRIDRILLLRRWPDRLARGGCACCWCR